jgi:hypothetical protein
MNKKISILFKLLVLFGLTSYGQRDLPIMNGTQFAKMNSGAMQIDAYIVCDNDFAILLGTQDHISRIVYQNDVGWSDQISGVKVARFTKNENEDTLYLLALGGGLNEDIGGTINGKDITKFNALQSQDIAKKLSGYEYASVEAGSYNANLKDILEAYREIQWEKPTTKKSGAGSSVTGIGYAFPQKTAVLYKIDLKGL